MTARKRPIASVVIPCLNEEESIGGLVEDVIAIRDDPATAVEIRTIIVVDNGSTDETPNVARRAGARIVTEPLRGYGRACLSGVLASGCVDYIILMDGDRSDVPADLPALLSPVLSGEADLVVGSRTLGSYEKGSLLPQQVFGNRVAALLARLLYGVRLTDIGPFRVIGRRTLLQLGMREMTYGWSIEMIIRAARAGLTVREVPVRYRKRAGGRSKVSGNLKGTVRAGYRIITAIVRARNDDRPMPDDLASWLDRHPIDEGDS
jgi:glycosyltransferase involved in cell wall biosynthesis